MDWCRRETGNAGHMFPSVKQVFGNVFFGVTIFVIGCIVRIHVQTQMLVTII